MVKPPFVYVCSCGKPNKDEHDKHLHNNMDDEERKYSNSKSLLFLVNTSSGVGKGNILVNHVNNHSAPFDGEWHAIELLRFADPEKCDAAQTELLQWLDSHENIRIVVAGGDGSVKWVMSILSELTLNKPVPPIAVMPVGTGNELSRVTGWGINNKWGVNKLKDYTDLIFKGDIFDLDIWNVDIKTTKEIADIKDSLASASNRNLNTNLSEGEESPVDIHQKLVGFFTFGLDADIAMKYHEYRENLKAKGSPPTNIYKSRGMHVLWAFEKLVGKKEEICNYFRLKVDGEVIELPKGIRNLMFHNCHTSSGGTYYWGHSKKSRGKDLVKEPKELSACDGLIEVSAITGVVHLTGSLLKATHARRIAQGSQVELEVIKDIYAQLDGEPWIQPANSTVTISLALPHKIQLIGGPGESLNMGRRAADARELLDTIPEVRAEPEEIQVVSSEKLLHKDVPLDNNNRADSPHNNANQSDIIIEA